MKRLNSNFENEWKDLFQDAEMPSSASVWDKIDANLAGSQLSGYKKKLFYYKITAAASILLAMLFGSYILYNAIQDPESPQVAQDLKIGDNNITIEEKNMDLQESIIKRAEINNIEDQNNSSESSISEMIMLSSSETNDGTSTNSNPKGTVLSLAVIRDNNTVTDQSGIAFMPASLFNVPYEKPGRKYYLNKKVNPYDMPYLLPIDEIIEEEDPKRLWAGVNFSSGIFDPNISYGGSSEIAQEASASTLGSVEKIYSSSADLQEQSNSIMSYKPEESSYESDVSFSYGLDFGYKFSKRFVVLSGLGYQHNYGSTTVNTYIEPTATHTKYANHAIVIERASPESGLDTYNELNSEVQLNSTFEFVTIPVNFGYYLIDKKFKWMMTAGVTTDIFIKNSIDDSQNLFNQIQYKNGGDSPYNPIYFNGKFGTMLNYSFLKNYQVSLEPSYRIGISDLTKDNAAFSSRPSSFIISAGIAYVF